MKNIKIQSPGFYYIQVLFVLLSQIVFFPLSAVAIIKLPAIFGDHMVLQQQRMLPIWGTARAGESVTVNFKGKRATTTAGLDGKWRIDLPYLPVGTSPGTLTISGENTVTIKDVLVGDVWVCSGQSNMEFPLNSAHNAKDVVPAATDDQIRLFHIPNTTAISPREDIKAIWEVCLPEQVRKFSAVGYFFAKNLRPVIKRPIGLIESAYGGTPAQSWTDLSSLMDNPALQHYVGVFEKINADFPGGDSEFVEKLAAYELEAQRMREAAKTDTAYQAALSKWRQASDQARAAGLNIPPAPRAKEPHGLSVNKLTPTVLFNGMIAPIIPFAIKGVIWYQGETNARPTTTAAEYGTLFPAMITGWRKLWKQGDFPFLFVQLSNFASPIDNWPVLRESQLKALKLSNTAVTVTIDIGTGKNIHPPDKADVGFRLSLSARHIAYGENIVYCGPLYKSMKVEGNKFRVSFQSDSFGKGLIVGVTPWTDPGKTSVSVTDLVGFEVSGEDRNWVDAQAKIEGNTIVIYSPIVSHPVAVRYAWANNPSCNLYNSDGLPASPFRTDDWE